MVKESGEKQIIQRIGAAHQNVPRVMYCAESSPAHTGPASSASADCSRLKSWPQCHNSDVQNPRCPHPDSRRLAERVHSILCSRSAAKTPPASDTPCARRGDIARIKNAAPPGGEDRKDRGSRTCLRRISALAPSGRPLRRCHRAHSGRSSRKPSHQRTEWRRLAESSGRCSPPPDIRETDEFLGSSFSWKAPEDDRQLSPP